MFYKNIYNIFLILKVTLFTKIIFFNFSVIDYLYRINLNDHFLAFYHFWWTSAWYLNFFIFLSLFFYLFFFKTKVSPFTLFLIIYCIFYSVEISLFFLSNFTFSFFNLNTNEFNFFLFNAFNKYHPYVLYFSVFLTITTVSRVLFFLYVKVFFLKNVFFFFAQRFCIYLIFIFNFLALFLGSWWALQEGSWGGWWNWDASETLGLLVFSFAAIYQHYQNFFYDKTGQFVYLVLKLLFLFIAYFFTQLNFDITSHNFGIKFFYFFNNNFFLLEVSCFYVFFTVYFIFLISFLNFNYALSFGYVFKLNYGFLFNSSLNFFFFHAYAYALVLSFNLLFNFFLSSFFNVNIINYELSFSLLLFSVVLLFIYLSPKALNFLTPFYFFTSYYFFSLVVVLVFSFSPLRAAHLFANFFLYAVAASTNLAILYWFFLTELTDCWACGHLLFFSFKNYSLNTFFLDSLLVFFYNDFWLFYWTPVNLFFESSGPLFALFFSVVGPANLIKLNHFFLQLTLYHEALILSILFLLFWLSWLSSIFFFTRLKRPNCR